MGRADRERFRAEVRPVGLGKTPSSPVGEAKKAIRRSARMGRRESGGLRYAPGMLCCGDGPRMRLRRGRLCWGRGGACRRGRLREGRGVKDGRDINKGGAGGGRGRLRSE